MRIKGQCQRDGRNINDTLMPDGFQSAGRAGVISVRDADDEHQSGGRSRQPHEADTGAPDCQSVFRRDRGGRNHGNHPVLIRHNRHGGGLRQLPAHDA